MLINQSFEKFDHNGSKIPGDTSLNDKHCDLPPWFDKKRFIEAKSLLDKYFFSIFFTHLSGLVLLVFIRSIYTTLAKSGKSNDLVSIFFRYWHTILHVKSWYEGQVWDPNDSAYKSIVAVKQMHKNVSQIQNRKKVHGVNELAISQRDMSLTQFAFVGLIVLYPEQMGFPNDQKQIEKLVYFWAVIGYMLGIEDQYNLCRGDYEGVKKACENILEIKYRPVLSSLDEDANLMSSMIVYTSSKFVFWLRYNSFIKYLLEVVSVENQLRLSNNDRIAYRILKLFASKLVHYRLVAVVLNGFLRWSFYTVQFKWILKSIVKSLTTKQMN